MSRLTRVLVAAILIVVLVWLVVFLFGGRARSAPRPRDTLSTTARMDLTGIVEPVARASAWYAAVHIDLERRWYTEVSARAAAARRARSAPRHTSSSGGGAVTGDCAAMAPAGFPGYIVQRESGGDPNAVNSSSGARGCAQIMPAHFSRTCAGMTYAQCWAALWANGAGASNWSTG